MVNAELVKRESNYRVLKIKDNDHRNSIQVSEYINQQSSQWFDEGKFMAAYLRAVAVLDALFVGSGKFHATTDGPRFLDTPGVGLRVLWPDNDVYYHVDENYIKELMCHTT